MATRIYQGRILSAEYENRAADFRPQISATDSIIFTFNLFQDAVNYHLVALAGMADTAGNSPSARFSKQVESVWELPPRGKTHAQTLQQSICRTLNLSPQASFRDAVHEIFKNTADPELLPYVLQIVIDRTATGEGAIQQEGRSLLPKLCDINFKGNYDYSSKEKAATSGKLRLQRELNRPDITDEELISLANEMDLSWAGIKTQPNASHDGSMLFSAAETAQEIAAAMSDLSKTLQTNEDPAWKKLAIDKNIDIYSQVREILSAAPTVNTNHLLAKNNKAAPTLKQAAIFFMYYPCRLSAMLLSAKLGKEKKQKNEASEYDCSKLINDPILLCRGQNKYIYRGFTALPDWDQEGALMYSAEWDILAFKEALKTLHSYEQKTEERNQQVKELQNELDYLEKGIGKPASHDEGDTPAPVLGGDPRFELLKELVNEIAPGDYENYTISRRALKNYEELRNKWLAAERAGKGDTETLINIVRKTQGEGPRFGSGVLYEALCQDKYKAIWHEWQDSSKRPLPRSLNILQDFNRWQELKQEIEQYQQPVRITPAEPKVSPRQLLFSDLKNFGPKSKGHEFIKGSPGMLRLRVAVRNAKGHLTATGIVVRYSAPRFERDELGTDSALWTADKKGATELNSWLQPMMKALQLSDTNFHLNKEPAVGLQVKQRDGKSKNNEIVCLLNFPVSIDFEKIHKQIGKADIWSGQMLGGQNEKLHLHWPGTYAGKTPGWWKSPQIINNGFKVLGIDLGVRHAAAWALVDVQDTPKQYTHTGAEINGRFIGCADNKNWYGYCKKNGLIRIDGEGKGPDIEEKNSPAIGGVGKPTPDDMKLAEELFRMVGFTDYSSCNIIELCNLANKAFRRLLSRCRKYQSLLVGLKDSQKQQNAIEDAANYFSYNEATRQFIPGILDSLNSKDTKNAQSQLLSALLDLRKTLPKAAETLTNLLLPRKRGKWVWQPENRPGYICSGRMVIGDTPSPTRKIFYRGGLSIKRLTQIEDLRRLLQSMNRILHETPGIQADFGHALKNVQVVDPCPDILRKIENIREQRVNKIAHEITALALGLQLIAGRKGKNKQGRDIIHGEYTTIPNRKPVDFVVLENLSRYRTSIDRTPEENSTLMRWAHRQIVAKVTQLLEEVFGIPVLFTHAAYTSKFDSYTSVPGFRAVEMTERRLNNFADKADDNKVQLAGIYKQILKSANGRRDGLKLLMPGIANNGEFFICNTPYGVRMLNADINAAINIAWRGLAAPEAIHLLHRVRLCKEKGKIKPRYSNKREEALKKNWEFLPENTDVQVRDYDSAFQVAQELPIPTLAQYSAPNSQISYRLAYAKDIWLHIKKQHWNLCNQFNIKILKKIGIDTSLLEHFLAKRDLFSEDDSDIPL